ncbi:hypothetical protein [Paenibacillus tianjinensis]|uniref:Helix-turn-helix domain-containing protein n=1 Tax=Paenibacillus tianjinensis TaxID=2810347 RepID=A0ABX7LFW7_9BACL|nr:hypothetical protein [Paenibacillus tianjinensis]QSF46957.1 hypothetical protein JRJ22_10545 [Paenibacillus tianjinensis]
MNTNQITVLAASLILGLSLIIGCLILGNERASSTDKEIEAQIAETETEAKTQAALMEQARSKDKAVMTLQETAQFLNLQEDQVLNIIKAENSILSNNGVFNGDRLPFFKVDNEFMFSKAEILEWVRTVMSETRIYRGDRIIR